MGTTQGLWIPGGKSRERKAEPAQKSQTQQAIRIFFCKTHFGHRTRGDSVLQGKGWSSFVCVKWHPPVQFKYKIKVVTDLFQLLTSFSSCFAEKKRIVPCLPKQASGVWCVYLYTGRQGEVCMVYKYTRARNTALIAQLYHGWRWHQIILCNSRRFFQSYTIVGSCTRDQETPTNWFQVTKHAVDTGDFVHYIHHPPQKLSDIDYNILICFVSRLVCLA